MVTSIISDLLWGFLFFYSIFSIELTLTNSYSNVSDHPYFHDTWKLLKHYRDVVWSLESSVQHLRNSFQTEFGTNIDDFLDSMQTAGVDLSESDINYHAKCIERSRKMLKILESGIDLMRTKHKRGEEYYWVLYYTFLSPQQLADIDEIIEKLPICVSEKQRIN